MLIPRVVVCMNDLSSRERRDMSIKKMDKMDGTMLIDCIKLPLKEESDFRNAIDKVMNTKIKQYSKLFKMFILLLSVFGDQCKDRCKDLLFL